MTHQNGTGASSRIKTRVKENKRETTTGSPPRGAVVVSSEEVETVRGEYARTTRGRELPAGTAARWLRRFGKERVLRQIALLGESLEHGHVIPRPEGWVTAALQEGWRSNDEAAREARAREEAARAAARAEKQRMLREAWERYINSS